MNHAINWIIDILNSNFFLNYYYRKITFNLIIIFTNFFLIICFYALFIHHKFLLNENLQINLDKNLLLNLLNHKKIMLNLKKLNFQDY